MIDPNVLDKLTKRLSDSVPDSFKLLQGDLEKNFKTTVQGIFNEMNLVSRDEFDIQAALLARTVEKLKALEERVKQLENK